MSFQAYLDNIEEKSGKTPNEFIAMAKEKDYPMSFAAVQKHVAVLERAGLVTKERTGRRKVVSTRVEGLQAVQDLLDRYEDLWRQRIARMTDLSTHTEETDE